MKSAPPGPLNRPEDKKYIEQMIFLLCLLGSRVKRPRAVAFVLHGVFFFFCSPTIILLYIYSVPQSPDHYMLNLNPGNFFKKFSEGPITDEQYCVRRIPENCDFLNDYQRFGYTDFHSNDACD